MNSSDMQDHLSRLCIDESMSALALKNLRKLRWADKKLDAPTSIEVLKSLRPKLSFPQIASISLEQLLWAMARVTRWASEGFTSGNDIITLGDGAGDAVAERPPRPRTDGQRIPRRLAGLHPEPLSNAALFA
jgi:hypothetical protein